MKKKVLSFLVAVGIISNMFVITNVSAEEIQISVPFDLSAKFNARSFLSNDEAGSITGASIPDFFTGTTLTSENAIALNRDAVSAIMENGVLKYNGASYLMPLPVDGQDSYSYQQGGALEFSAVYADEVRLLVTTVDGFGAERGKIYNALRYSDNVTQNCPAIKPYKHDSSETTGLVVSCGTVNATKDGATNAGGNIYEYVIVNSNPEKMIKRVSLSRGGSENSGTRIFAVTFILKESTVKRKIKEDIAKVLESENPSYEQVVSIDEYINYVKMQGCTVDDVEGIDEFLAYKKKFVLVKNYSESTDFDETNLDIAFTAPISEDSVVKENFKVIANDKELEFDIEAIREEDAITGIKIKIPNELNYTDEVCVVLSANIKNAEDEKFTLGEIYEIKFTPTAPTVYIKDVNVIKSSNAVSCEVKLQNNSEEPKSFAVTIGIYSQDNEMKARKTFTGMIDSEKSLQYETDVDGEYSFEVYLFNSFTDMELLNCPVVK